MIIIIMAGVIERTIRPKLAALVRHVRLLIKTLLPPPPAPLTAKRQETRCDEHHRNTSPSEQTSLASSAAAPSAPPCPDYAARPAAPIFTDGSARYDVTGNDVTGPAGRELMYDETSGVTVPGEDLAPPGYGVAWPAQEARMFDPCQPPPSYEEVVAAQDKGAK